MSTDESRRRTPQPSSAPPGPAPLDAHWDDETVPGFVLDDPLNEFDRVTAIPELPSEQYVKQVMDSAEDTRGSQPPTTRPAPPNHAVTLPPEDYRSIAPDAELSADSTAPYLALSLQSAETARPMTMTTVRSPGLAARPDLAELDSIGSLKAEPLADGAATDPDLQRALQAPRPLQLEATEADPLAEMKDRYAMGDFSGALASAEQVLAEDPDQHEASRYAQSCRDVLTQMFSARLGSLDQVVAMAVASDQIRWLTLDHRAGFLLSLVDGHSTIDQILDISGMTRLDALRIMYQLVDQRVISLGT